MSIGHLRSRAIVRVSPTDPAEDAAGFLQGLLTNDVTGPGPTYAGLLTPQGKALFDMMVWHDGTDMVLDCEAEAAEDLVRRLSLYRLRRKLSIAVDPALAVLWSERLAEGFAPDPRLPALGYRRIGPADGEPLDERYLALRLSLGVAEGRGELADVLWLETNAAELNGVSFTKGCYIGQENTARMNWRSKVNRRLVVVPIDRSDPKRQVAAYPALRLAVDHLRVEDIQADLVPDWMGIAG